MKIAVFSDTFYPSVDGVIVSIINNMRLMAEKGHEILIFAPDYRIKHELKIHKNIRIVRFFSFASPTYKEVKICIPNLIKSLRIIKDFRPDVIHFHGPVNFGWVAVLSSEIFRIPLIGTYHTLLPDFAEKYMTFKGITKLDRIFNGDDLLKNDPPAKNKSKRHFVWQFTNKIYNRCSIVTTPSHAMKQELVKHKLKRRIKVVSNGIDLSMFYKNKKKNKGFRLLHLGRVSFEKNIEVVIKAFNLVLKEYPEITLSIVGRGPARKKLESLAKRLGIGKNINFTGNITRDKLNSVYNDHDLFVTASTIETQGIAILEAMASGLPVIGVDKLAIPELVRNGKTGFTVKPYDFVAMAKKIKIIIEDKNLRKKMSENTLKTAEKHDLKKVSSEWEGIYRSLISQANKKI